MKKILVFLCIALSQTTFAIPTFNEEQTVVLKGKVQVLKGLEDTYPGAENDRYPAISLNQSIIVNTMDGKVTTRLLQLADLTGKNVIPKSFYKNVGKPLTVTCKGFYHSDNAHHITKALCQVIKVSF